MLKYVFGKMADLVSTHFVSTWMGLGIWTQNRSLGFIFQD